MLISLQILWHLFLVFNCPLWCCYVGSIGGLNCQNSWKNAPNLNVSSVYIYQSPMWYYLSRAAAALISVFTSVGSNFNWDKSDVFSSVLSSSVPRCNLRLISGRRKLLTPVDVTGLSAILFNPNHCEHGAVTIMFTWLDFDRSGCHIAVEY